MKSRKTVFSWSCDARLWFYFFFNYRNSRPEVFCKKVFLKTLQNSQENTCVSLFFNKVAGRPASLLKKILWHRRLPVNFAKFSRTLYFKRTPLVAASSIRRRLYVLIISRSRFTVNPHSIVARMLRNSLLETDVITEV